MKPHNFGFVIEQQLGHITHNQNLKQTIDNDFTVQSTWIPVPLDANDHWQKISNVSLRLSLRARDLTRKSEQQKRLDCLLFHTPMITLFSVKLMQRIPTVLSLDTTPINFNTIATAYDSIPPQGSLARLKSAWYRSIFHKAVALVTWSNWVKQSLEQDYGVDGSKVKVIPPGVNLRQWSPTIKEIGQNGTLRLLFVGKDFERKGGKVLLNAFNQGLADFCRLDIVTSDESVCSEGAVHVHRGLKPNSQPLKQLFAEADIFVFPTLGDATPLAILEAMASGLPVVTTAVGALSEQVENGVTGWVVPPNDPGAITEAICALASNPVRRVSMGAAGRAAAERRFDAEQNARALLSVLKNCQNLTATHN